MRMCRVDLCRPRRHGLEATQQSTGLWPRLTRYLQGCLPASQCFNAYAQTLLQGTLQLWVGSPLWPWGVRGHPVWPAGAWEGTLCGLQGRGRAPRVA